jgi:putative tryptophan/tyrosine transport system substrate-binding protein
VADCCACAEKVFRVGLVLTTTPDSEMVGPDPIYPPSGAFAHALRGLGYIEERNLVLERRSAEGRFERLGDIVAELVRLRADVIVTGGNPAARAAKAVTATVPIVAVGVADLVADGLVESLARPGGNVTGLTIRVGSESEAKRLQRCCPASLASPTSAARKTKTGRVHGGRAFGQRRRP